MVIYHQTKQNITLKHIQDLEEESFLLQTSKENGQFVFAAITGDETDLRARRAKEALPPVPERVSLSPVRIWRQRMPR